MSKEDGGAAFPVIEKQYEDHRDGGFFYEGTAGMTLRDYFAAKVMAVIAADQIKQGNTEKEDGELCASAAYKLADCMIAERTK